MIRKWLREWLGINEMDTRLDALSAQSRQDAARFDVLDQAIAANEAARVADMSEIRERLEMPAKKKSSGRPFAVLAKVAELGARAQRMKDAG